MLAMASYTAQVIGRANSGLSRDNSVNTLHFVQPAGANLPLLASDLQTAFKEELGGNGAKVGGISRYDVKIYEDGAPPNPPEVTHIGDNGFFQAAGPREVALCLSFKGAPVGSGGGMAGALPKWRGRIFIGPIGSTHTSTERPSETLRTAVKNLGMRIFDAGDDEMLWVCGSESVPVTRIWVDDEWDTQRRRGLRPTVRNEVNAADGSP
jgi:hypothetical protein